MRRCVSCQAPVPELASFCTACGARLPATETSENNEALEPDEKTQLSDPLIGRVIGRNFRIEALLGVGGMGKVYRATQISLEKTVALKVLHAQYATDETLVHRFKREARAASRLNHPNIIQIIDFGSDRDGLLYMAMEFLAGRDLAGLLREDFPLGDQRVAQIGLQVCAALIEAHGKGVIHRDLKPSNIVVESRPEQPDFIKLFDFGIAKVETPHGRQSRILTTGGVVCGTPEYMSPEQIRGQTLDPRCDLYSLGIMLYQLSTQQLPFRADSPIDIAAKHVTTLPLPPRQLCQEISNEFEIIILRCLQKKPEDRYDSAQQLAQALRPIAEYSSPGTDILFNEKSIQRSIPSDVLNPGTDLTDSVVSPEVGLAAVTLRDSVFADEKHTVPSQLWSRPASTAAGSDIDATQVDPSPLPDRDSPLATGSLTEDQQPAATAHTTEHALNAPSRPVLPSAIAVAVVLASSLLAVSLWQSLRRPDSSTAQTTADAGRASPPKSADATILTAATDPATHQTPIARPSDAPHSVKDRNEPPSNPPTHTAPQPVHKRPGRTIDQKTRRRRVRELLRKGDKRHMAGDYVEALRYYRKARDAAPRNAQVYRKLAMAHYSLGNYAQACHSFRTYFKLSSHPQGEDRLRQFVRGICKPEHTLPEKTYRTH